MYPYFPCPDSVFNFSEDVEVTILDYGASVLAPTLHKTLNLLVFETPINLLFFHILFFKKNLVHNIA